MNRKRRRALLVVIDAFALSANLGVYFTTQDVLSLCFTTIFAGLFIIDWNAWLKK